ncbi:hypothetical protein CLAFUW4_02393 [Fulvia fulva]|uniref:DUF7703 domain-containing protein n=1 Tax=Passalora fulva TaxID=5499 RepID=A0A9Q8LAK2_PASFU|nr:uncharacterized protein CLAFUR5_02381 [Fulvia fulva]KAK4631196.1 hypothetical protein CLAFUR4_02388 [Fulvia fulva]KAK4633359.1 hypothetical protein CLAFUR0_02392 [Fulvia fulva]UJO13955.1 hypothetical protein CLAFUR5_02381 [Fulvia fulva]WPV10935.1 hypothetical protein CLAFUW4_02393 [Fulvia fulva]WPV25872.1 hypothetical protein CLAFUW7_02393 [Fulvia fulva]
MSGIPNTSSGPSEETWNGRYNGYTATVTICSAVSLYNAIELGLLIITTFKQWSGLYFWSMAVSTLGLLPYNIGFMIEYFNLTHLAVGKSLDGIGWIMLITGQALVLYSRLGLILHNPTILRCIKYMIIFNAIVWHTTTEVLNFGQAFGPVRPNSPNRAGFETGYRYVEKVQMTVFCVQEFIISGVYVWQTVKLLKVISKKGTRRVMWQLFIVNVVIIILDIGLLAIEYKDQHVLEQTIKGFTYSIKLKLEFVILGKLVDLVQSSKRTLSGAFVGGESYSTAATGELYQDTHDPRPRWLRDLERRSSATHTIGKDASGETGTSSITAKGPTTMSMDFSEFENEMPAPLPLSLETYTRREETYRRRRGAGGVMYAEALRGMGLSRSRGVGMNGGA